MKISQSIRKVIILASIFFFVKNGFASPQLPDYLIYKGDTITVYNLILEQYFEEINKSDQGSLFGLKFRDGASLNCWRGYQAIYSIENDSLLLTGIIHCGEIYSGSLINQEVSRERINKIFWDKVVNGKVFLNWYTGEISIPNGSLLRWDGVFHKSFEKEVLIKVKDGSIKSTSDISNYIDEPDRINRRYQDTISTVLFKELEKIKWKKIDEFDCSEKYLITIDSNGEVSKVTMAEYQTKAEIKEFWDRNEYNYCIRAIEKGLKGLKFDILKMNGIPIEEEVYIEIWLEENGKLENWTD